MVWSVIVGGSDTIAKQIGLCKRQKVKLIFIRVLWNLESNVQFFCLLLGVLVFVGVFWFFFCGDGFKLTF